MDALYSGAAHEAFTGLSAAVQCIDGRCICPCGLAGASGKDHRYDLLHVLGGLVSLRQSECPEVLACTVATLQCSGSQVSSEAVPGPAGLRDAFGAWLDWLCLEAACHFQCFIRSALLLYLLSVLHLWSRALTLRRGSHRRNAVVRCTRCGLRGASVWLALGFVASSPALVSAMPGGRPTALSGPNEAWRSDVDADAWIDGGRPDPHIAVTAREASRPTSAEEDMQVSGCLFRFQRSCAWAKEWVGPFESPAYVCQAFREEFYGEDALRNIVPVAPQPHVDYLAFVEAPAWLTNRLLSPVLFEVHSDPKVRFVEVLQGRTTLADLRVIVGDHWLAGGRFFVGDSREAVNEDEVLHIEPGTLIRLLPDRGALCTCLLCHFLG